MEISVAEINQDILSVIRRIESYEDFQENEINSWLEWDAYALTPMPSNQELIKC